MPSKSGLAVQLSKIESFKDPKLKREQYITDSEVAADMLWMAHLQGDIEGKRVLDLGCGTGILGIGALLLGASHVTFVDSDPDALEIVQKNLKSEGLESDFELIQEDIREICLKGDTALQNPPFGNRRTHADRAFLDAAMRSADVLYSIHMATTKSFLEVYTRDNGFRITHTQTHEFPLKSTYAHHRRRIHRIQTLTIRAQAIEPQIGTGD